MSFNDSIKAPGYAGGSILLTLSGRTHQLLPSAIAQVSERHDGGALMCLSDGKHINTRLDLLEVIEAIDEATNWGKPRGA